MNENNNYNDNEIGKLKIQENIVSYKSIASIGSTNILLMESKPIERKNIISNSNTELNNIEETQKRSVASINFLPLDENAIESKKCNFTSNEIFFEGEKKENEEHRKRKISIEKSKNML